MKKRKGLLFAVIAAAIVIADATLFDAQLFSTIWEARTGFHRDVHGIRFHVPLFYVSASDAQDSYTFSTLASPTRRKWAVISVSFPREASQVTWRPLSPEMLQRIGDRLAGQRAVTLAGKAGNCFEYAKVSTDQAPELSRTMQVECYFPSDVRTSFLGSSNTVEDFYTFMNRAEAMSKTN